MARLSKLKVSFKTGFEPFAGTDASIYLVLCLTEGACVYHLPTHKGELEAGKLDIFVASVPDGPDLADVRGFLVVNGMDGPRPGWYLLWVRIEAFDEQGCSWLCVDAMPEKWLDNGPGKSPVLVLPAKAPRVNLGQKDTVGSPTCALERVG